MLEEQLIDKGRSHNIFRRDVDDMELAKIYNLDPAVAYTPAINNAIVNAQYAETYKELVAQGVPDKKAKQTASEHRAEANKRVTASLKQLNAK